MKRKHYIDNLRWMFIILLIPFHAAMAWNSWGEGDYIYFHGNRVLSSLMIFMNPWYMSLLFLLAGMSTKYALQRRSYKEYIMERKNKILRPLGVGMLTVVAVMTYYADRYHNAYDGNFFKHYGVFFTRFTNLTGYDGGFTPAHFWFLFYLFLISMTGLLIIMLLHKAGRFQSGFKITLLFLFAGCVIYGVCDQLLNIADKSLVKFLFLFLAGYYIFSEENNLAIVSKYRYLTGGIALVADIFLTYRYIWCAAYNSIGCGILLYVSGWFGIMAFLGFGRLYLNQDNKITRYFTRNSFFFYIFHFMWLIILQYYMSKVISNIVILYLCSCIGTFGITILTCEIVSHIPLLNLLYGGKRRK